MDHNKDFNFIQDQVLLESGQIEVYTCNYCGIMQIYKQTFSQMKNLAHLGLNHNQLSHIAYDSFINTLRIRRIELNNNSLTGIPMDIFDITTLEILHIDLNKFEPSVENNQLLKRYKKTCRYGSNYEPYSIVSPTDYNETHLEYYSLPTIFTKCTIIEDRNKKVNENCYNYIIKSFFVIVIVPYVVVVGLVIYVCFKKSREENEESTDDSKPVSNENDIIE